MVLTLKKRTEKGTMKDVQTHKKKRKKITLMCSIKYYMKLEALRFRYYSNYLNMSYLHLNIPNIYTQYDTTYMIYNIIFICRMDMDKHYIIYSYIQFTCKRNVKSNKICQCCGIPFLNSTEKAIRYLNNSDLRVFKF